MQIDSDSHDWLSGGSREGAAASPLDGFLARGVEVAPPLDRPRRERRPSTPPPTQGYQFGTLHVIQTPFPRPGQRMVPRLLDGLLGGAWSKLHESLLTCGSDRDLGTIGLERADILEAAVDAVRVMIASRRKALSQLLLSDAGPLVNRTLHLAPRTANALARDGMLRERQGLSDATLREVCAVPAFGAVSLMDLLVSLESPVIPPPGSTG